MRSSLFTEQRLRELEEEVARLRLQMLDEAKETAARTRTGAEKPLRKLEEAVARIQARTQGAPCAPCPVPPTPAGERDTLRGISVLTAVIAVVVILAVAPHILMDILLAVVALFWWGVFFLLVFAVAALIFGEGAAWLLPLLMLFFLAGAWGILTAPFQ